MSETKERGIEPQKEQEPRMRLEELERLFEEEPRRIEEMKKVFSVSLQCALASDFEGRHPRWRRFDPYRDHPEDYLLIRTFEEVVESPPPWRTEEKKAWTTDREAILGADAKDRALAEIAFKVQSPERKASIWVSFPFSADKETAHRYFNQGQGMGHFAAPHELNFHGLFIDQPRETQRVPLAKASEHAQFAGLTIDRKLVKNLLEWIDWPIEDCKEAVTEIERLGKELGIDHEKIEKLKQAARDFATYVKPEPTTGEQCFREIGRCFTVPHTFRNFSRDWHGLEVDDDFYEHSYAGHATFFHQVNIMDGKMVIDWTARQYHQFDKEPYPFVYRVGDERVKSFGPLRHMEIMESKKR